MTCRYAPTHLLHRHIYIHTPTHLHTHKHTHLHHNECGIRLLDKEGHFGGKRRIKCVLFHRSGSFGASTFHNAVRVCSWSMGSYKHVQYSWVMKGRVCSREDTMSDIHTSVNRSIFLYVRTYACMYVYVCLTVNTLFRKKKWKVSCVMIEISANRQFEGCSQNLP